MELDILKADYLNISYRMNIYQHVANFSFVLTVGFVCEITDWETTLNFDHRGN